MKRFRDFVGVRWNTFMALFGIGYVLVMAILTLVFWLRPFSH